MNNKIYFKLVLILSLFLMGIIYGIAIHRHNIFPYTVIKTLYNLNQTPSLANTHDPWAIGLFKGPSPFDLSPPTDISNPIITKDTMTDMDAIFVADPFMLKKDETYYIFFEALNAETNQGDIAYAESTNLADWNYKKVILNEPFHLSYPYVFEWQNNYYLIPESHEDFSVRLYKAVKFPEQWEYVGNLLSGYRYVDNSLFRHADKWWMFVATGHNDVLNLYYSADLLQGWTAHPQNPIVKHNKHFSRPAGRVFSYDNKLYRLAQDDEPSYGLQVFAFEILELSETHYAEKLASPTPLVTQTGHGWNANGMHHLDLHHIDNEWIGIVDGRGE